MSHSRFLERLRESKLMLPPLAGYTDLPFRAVMASFNPPFLVTEMINAQAIIQRGSKTMRMIEKEEGTCLSGVQLVGSKPTVMAEAAKVVESVGFDYVDVNMGCIISKVARSGAGISLMKDEGNAYEVVSAMVGAVNIPVTCKIRLGATKESLNAVSLTLRLAEAGVAAVTVHGRSGEKKFGLPVDYEGIKEVVDALPIPVVANGGVFTGGDARLMLDETGAAAVMPGRGIIGNPWLITEITSTLSGSPYSPPSLREKKDVCLTHLRYLCDFYGEESGAMNMRKILPQYFSGCYHAKDLKRDVEKVTSSHEVVVVLDHIHDVGSKVVYGEYP